MTTSSRGNERRVFVSREHALLFTGQAASSLGDLVCDTTLVLWIADGVARDASWAPLAVSGALVATSAPTFLFGPLAGALVDRWNRRRTLLWADALRTLLLLVLLAASPVLSGVRLLSVIYVTVALASICALLFNPARLALIGLLIPDEQRAQVSGMAQMSVNFAMLVGPTLAGALYFTAGPAGALALNALSFAGSFMAIRSLNAPHARMATSGAPARDIATVSHGNVLRDVQEGLRFFCGNRTLWALLLTMVVILLGGGASSALGYFFVTENLHAAPSTYGLLSAASGVGFLIGAGLMSVAGQRLGVARMFWVGVLATGALELAYARTASLMPALVILALQGIPNAALNVAVGPLALRATPPHLIGRVWSILSPVMSLAETVSTATAGYLVATVLHGFHATALGVSFGPVDTIFTVGGSLSIAAGVLAMTLLWATDGPVLPPPGAPAHLVTDGVVTDGDATRDPL